MDSQARIETARALLAERRSALVETRKAGPPCTRCRFSVGPKIYPGETFCGHPAFEIHDFDVTTGKLTIAHETPVKKAREDLCGPEGVLFERRPISLKAVATVGAVAWVPFYYGLAALGFL